MNDNVFYLDDYRDSGGSYGDDYSESSTADDFKVVRLRLADLVDELVADLSRYAV